MKKMDEIIGENELLRKARKIVFCANLCIMGRGESSNYYRNNLNREILNWNILLDTYDLRKEVEKDEYLVRFCMKDYYHRLHSYKDLLVNYRPKLELTDDMIFSPIKPEII